MSENRSILHYTKNSPAANIVTNKWIVKRQLIRDYYCTYCFLSSLTRNAVRRKPLHFSLVNCTLCCIVRPVYSSRSVSLSRRVPLHLPAPIHSLLHMHDTILLPFARHSPGATGKMERITVSFICRPACADSLDNLDRRDLCKSISRHFLIKENVE